LFSTACVVRLWRPVGAEQQLPLSQEKRFVHASSPSGFVPYFWLLLAACASILLLAVTNKLCQDVAVIPFLWVLPLGLYLLSFIICFDNPRWYLRLPFTLALIAAIAALCWVLFKGSGASLYKQVLVYCGGLFICSMVCHGELYRLRPGTDQ